LNHYISITSTNLLCAHHAIQRQKHIFADLSLTNSSTFPGGWPPVCSVLSMMQLQQPGDLPLLGEIMRDR